MGTRQNTLLCCFQGGATIRCSSPTSLFRPPGQTLEGDRFNDLMSNISKYDTLVIGSPVYWHTVTGQMHTLLERIYLSDSRKALRGKDLFFIFQGAAPTRSALEFGDDLMATFARLFHLNYLGMATDRVEAAAAASKI